MIARVVALLLLAGCVPLTSLPGATPSHAVGGSDGNEWHSCAGGGACQEGWACVVDGCEWCGPGATRCTSGTD
jgi:hypothetical protein